MANWYSRTAPRINALRLRSQQQIWEEHWQDLSTPARLAFLRALKQPPNSSPHTVVFQPGRETPTVTILDELESRHFLVNRGVPRLNDEAQAFSSRLACLARCHLLTDASHPKLHAYLQYFFPYEELSVLTRKLFHAANLAWHPNFTDVENTCIPSRHWSEWVRKLLGNSPAMTLFDALQPFSQPLLLANLFEKVPQLKPDAVRKAHDVLFAHLVSFEDLDPRTGHILVGLLPSVRAALQRHANPSPRPVLAPQPTPKVLTPEGGEILIDLRAFLLELIASPARLRQEGDLYQREYERLATVLEPLPEVKKTDHDNPEDNRVDRAFKWARTLKLVKGQHRGAQSILQINGDGQEWLKMSLAQQFVYVADKLRLEDSAPSYGGTFDDSVYLQSSLAAWVGKQVVARENRRVYRNAFRKAIHGAFRALPVGVFVRLEDFLEHATYGEHNPMLLGHAIEEVTASDRFHRILPLDEAFVKAGRELLLHVVSGRLIPLGAVRFGRNDAGQALIARTPRLDIYFGVKPDKKSVEQIAEPAPASRVVVQPDFSVIIIGQDPAPVTDLLPFCERAGGSIDQGTIMLRISRETVLRAIADGLPGKAILDRLQRHSSTPLPANVLEEVRGWCSWVAEVHVAPATLIRCADSVLADRVVQALGKHAERVGPGVVAINTSKLSSPLRQRLRAQGLVVVNGLPADAPKPTKRKKK